MRAMQQWLDRFCARHPRLGIPGLMRYIVIGNVLVYLLDMFSKSGYAMGTGLLGFSASAILQGQVWRLFTYVFTYLLDVSGGYLLLPAAITFSSFSSPCISTTSSATPWRMSGGPISSPSSISSA